MNSGTRWSRAFAILSCLLLRRLRAASRTSRACLSSTRRCRESHAPLDRTLSPAEAQHPGESGFRLVIEGMEAFVIRAHSAQLAARSLDVQTYIWHADTTGLFLAQQLLAGRRSRRARAAAGGRHGRARQERGIRRARGASEHRSAPVQSVRLAQRRSAPGERGCCAISAASTAACTTRAGSPTTASRSWAAAISATNTSAPATR